MTLLRGLAMWTLIGFAVAGAWVAFFKSQTFAVLAHRLAHWRGRQPIEVVSEWRGDRLWMGARCLICHKVSKEADVTDTFAAITDYRDPVADASGQPSPEPDGTNAVPVA